MESCMFFACNSWKFARQWRDVFNITSEGGRGTLNFAVYAQSGTTKENVLNRLKGTFEWQVFPKK